MELALWLITFATAGGKSTAQNWLAARPARQRRWWPKLENENYFREAEVSLGRGIRAV
jgi:hypothetical protein